MKNLLSFATLLLLLAVVSCKKKDNEAQPATPAQQLAGTTSKDWKLTAATGAAFGQTFNLFEPFQVGTLQVPTLIEPCAQDNIFTFLANNTYQVKEGATQCTPPSEGSGTWTLSQDGKTLTITANGSNAGTALYSGVPITITSLTSTTLQGQFSTTYSSIPVTVNVTFTAQ